MKIKIDRYLLPLFLGAFLIPIFSVTDWVIYPQHAFLFLKIRLSLSIYLVFVILISPKFNNTKRGWLLWLSYIIVSIGLSMMCFLSNEGFKSPYYSGLTLIILTASILSNWKTSHFTFLTLAILVIHFALQSTVIFDLNGFIMNFFVLGGSAFLAIFLNSFLYKIKRQNDYVVKVFTHDIKNQLFAILTNLFLIQRQKEQDTHLLNGITTNIKKCSIMSGNLLNIFEAEENHLQIDKTKCSLDILDDHFNEQWNHLFQVKNIDVNIDISNVKVFLDVNYMTLVWDNLIANALEHTPTNGIFRIREYQLDNRHLLLFLNSGPVVSNQNLKELFSKYTSKSKKTVFKKGLGLHFSKIMMKMHEGSISYTIQNNLNCFKLEFPSIE